MAYYVVLNRLTDQALAGSFLDSAGAEERPERSCQSLAATSSGINTAVFPPATFLPTPMKLTMVKRAQRNDKFIAYFQRKPTRLGEGQVMRMGWLPATNEAGAGSDGSEMRFIA